MHSITKQKLKINYITNFTYSLLFSLLIFLYFLSTKLIFLFFIVISQITPLNKGKQPKNIRKNKRGQTKPTDESHEKTKIKSKGSRSWLEIHMFLLVWQEHVPTMRATTALQWQGHLRRRSNRRLTGNKPETEPRTKHLAVDDIRRWRRHYLQHLSLYREISYIRG